MTISQLSVFAENKAGAICEVTNTLAEAGIDIRAFNVAETKDFGILRLIVNDAEKAKKALAEKECVVSITDVIGVVVPDAPGGLAKVLSAVNGINVEYIYAFVSVSGSHAYVVLRVDDNDAAIKVLKDAGFNLLSDDIVKKM
ncbi:MAG: ACT domain-containing protein [Ruminococcaceae bacterium]|nr:ACT domain-containing protein [Oscillospiraceae bacterium]